MANVQALLDPILLQRSADDLLSHANWSRSELLEHQGRQLRTLLSNAVKHSHWYERSIGELVKRQRPLSEFPVLTKQVLMANFDEIILDKRVTLAGVEEHLSGPNSGERYLGKYFVFPTGGTSGLRAIIVFDEPAWRNVVASMIRFLQQAGLQPDGRVIAIGANSALHISGRAYAELRKWRPGAPDLDVTMPIGAIADALNDYQPDIIMTYPSFIRTLAVEQQNGRLKIAPSKFGAVAESLSEDIRELVRKVWNAKILNRYNATEIGCAASECANPNGLHLPEDLVVFESVDDNNQPVSDGVPGRKLLITTLTNSVLPLIRYELSDLLAVTEKTCSCGQPFARITTISGRREELLELPGRDGLTREVPAIYLVAPLVKVPFLKQFQIVLRRNELEARLVVADPRMADEAKKRTHKEIAEALDNRGVNIRLRVSVVDEIPRQGTGAKIKLVVKE
jgi:phenylacetate-CoA ligase